MAAQRHISPSCTCLVGSALTKTSSQDFAVHGHSFRIGAVTAALAGSLIQTLGHRRSPAFVTHFIPPCHCDSSIPWLVTCTLQDLYLGEPGFGAHVTTQSAPPPLVHYLLLHRTQFSYWGSGCSTTFKL